MMQLSKNNIHKIVRRADLDIPDENVFESPEKVLQFGTGVLLRALPDYFIDKANKQGIFNGRVVVVKSTSGDSSAFDDQDSLYTVCIRGIENGMEVEENIINASISRVLNSKTEWHRILECAHNPELNIIISNTTEVGIQLVQDDINAAPPDSFPGKLLAFLFERFKAFNGSKESGMIIVPTELITNNGDMLESIVLELAHRNNLDYKFFEWLERCNVFCNSLVDRIVPGKPNDAEIKKMETTLGYEDELMTMSEVFRLWAIEGDEKVKEVLAFHKVDKAVVITPDINLYRELKLRLLNGTHTFNCGLAYLSGFNITREAMNDAVYGQFTKALMHNEIARAIPYEIDDEIKTDFANKVFERFCNPFIGHQWQSITVQYTSKMRMRNIPLLQKYFELYKEVPLHMATGFAAYILYMKAVRKEGDKYLGKRNGSGNFREEYEIKDDIAGYFFNLWNEYDADVVVKKVLSNEEVWGLDLTSLPGYLKEVQRQLSSMLRNGVLETVTALQTKNVTVQ